MNVSNGELNLNSLAMAIPYDGAFATLAALRVEISGDKHGGLLRDTADLQASGNDALFPEWPVGLQRAGERNSIASAQTDAGHVGQR